MKLFISYSCDDKQYVYELADRLRDDGNHSVWIDRSALVGGESCWDAILDGIEGCECAIVVLSPRSRSSVYCDAELRYAQALNKPILPLVLIRVDLPDHLRAIQAEQIGDISLERAYGKCERALGSIALALEQARFPAPTAKPSRPSIPVLQAGQSSEHVFDIYVNAVEAITKDSAHARKLFQQVIAADPNGLGLRATDRLVELDFDEDRLKAYLAIARLVGNPALRKDAMRTWKAYTTKYGADYDPSGYGQTLGDVPPPPPPAEPKRVASVNTLVQRRLLDVMLDINRPPEMRAQAGQEINQFGDPRPGVLDFNWGDNYWCKVPAGEFTMGDPSVSDNLPRKLKIDYDFWIGKYPITYAQYKRFLDAPDGFVNTAWWEGMHADGAKQQSHGAGDQKFKYANHPAENVSWYDAIAFCRWLSAKLGYTISLPTEEQWEKAARGSDGREYPWGNGYEVGRANINESSLEGGTYLGLTSAVGSYPGGISPYGVMDLAGNVREWTLTECSIRERQNINSKESWVVRGGSWRFGEGDAHAAFRRFRGADLRSNRDGFRLCCERIVAN